MDVDADGAADAMPEGASIAEPGTGAAESSSRVSGAAPPPEQPRRKRRSRVKDDLEQFCMGECLEQETKGLQSKRQMEKAFFEYFGKLVSEWNP